MTPKQSIGYFLLAACTLATAKLPAVSAESIAAKYGKPDRVTSSVNEKPRPPIVTQFLDYRRERVRFILIPDAPMGSPPPYKQWLLMGITDPTTNQPLKAAEIERRMQKRLNR